MPQITISIYVPAMDCPVEEREIREALQDHKGIHELSFNLTDRILKVSIDSHATSAEKILAVLKSLDMPGTLIESAHDHAHRSFSIRVPAMDCPVEEREIREALQDHKGIHELSFNLTDRILKVSIDLHATSAEKILAVLKSLDMPGTLIESADKTNDDAIRIRVPAMDCPVEEREIREALQDRDGVRELAFNLTDRVLSVSLVPGVATAEEILAVLESLGMPGTLLDEGCRDETVLQLESVAPAILEQVQALIRGSNAHLDEKSGTVRLRGSVQDALALSERISKAGIAVRFASAKKLPDAAPAKTLWVRLGAALILAMISETLELTHALPDTAILATSLMAIALSGYRTILKGVSNLLRLRFTMSTLMAVAVTGAVILGEWPEAAMVMALFEIGEAIEGMSMTRTKRALEGLLNKTPREATVRVGNEWKRMSVDGLPAGVVFRVAPGERAAFDGIVTEGVGSMDESMITGESLPVEKKAGSDVWAGALSCDTALTVRSTARADESMTGRIIRAVSEAEQKKAPLQTFIDRFAAIYTPSVFALALATAALGSLLGSEPATVWIYRALVLLVIACPCALVISTPVTIVSALALAARNGILVKGGVYLEAARTIRTVALDKTGTVTRGEPSFASITVTGLCDEKQALRLAGSLASMSSHPVSRAIAAELLARGLTLLPVLEFKELAGRGTQGKVNGSLMHLVNSRWLEENGTVPAPVRAAFDHAYDLGQSAVALVDRLGPIAVIAVADTIKDGVPEAIATLKACSIDTWMLTGDNARAAEAIAHEAGIANVKAELLPQDKAREVGLLDDAAPTAMVGDGINDAPALSRARIGIAMGIRGADTSIEASDVTLMDDDIKKIAWLTELSRLTHSTLMTNIGFALLVKASFAVAAVFGFASMWAAVFADTGVTLIVVAWGLRLMKAKGVVDRRLARACSAVK